MRRILLASLVTVLALGAIGCAKVKLPTIRSLWGDRGPAQGSTTVDPSEVQPWTGYPAEAALGEDLDIIVTQAGGNLTLVNRTPRSFQNVQMWLNREYRADLGEIRLGSDTRVSLKRFVNKHGESFPIAGLLTPDKGFPVLSCVLFDPTTGQRRRLLARQ